MFVINDAIISLMDYYLYFAEMLVKFIRIRYDMKIHDGVLGQHHKII